MTFLDFSAAFDTVDHEILIKRLETNFGIRGMALSWFKSYLDNRSYKVKINNTLSNPQGLKFGVPQGSILGPILYSLYVKEIEGIAAGCKVKVHIYADDVVLYTNEISRLQKCLNEIKVWTSKNFLKLNNNKTKLLCLSPRNSKLLKPDYINLMGEDIKVESVVKYLGIWLDKNLTMSKQINSVCSQGYLMLRNLWQISSKVTDVDLRTQLIHSCILSKLNFCSSLYVSLPKKELNKLDRGSEFLKRPKSESDQGQKF